MAFSEDRSIMTYNLRVSLPVHRQHSFCCHINPDPLPALSLLTEVLTDLLLAEVAKAAFTGLESSGSGAFKAVTCCWSTVLSVWGVEAIVCILDFVAWGGFFTLLLAVKKLMTFIAGMIEFPSVCHVLF